MESVEAAGMNMTLEEAVQRIADLEDEVRTLGDPRVGETIALQCSILQQERDAVRKFADDYKARLDDSARYVETYRKCMTEARENVGTLLERVARLEAACAKKNAALLIAVNEATRAGPAHPEQWWLDEKQLDQLQDAAACEVGT